MLNNIQVLRAIAALNVVFVHIIMSGNDYNYPLKTFAFLKDWGANGVDIFFVISGFIMFYIQSLKKRTPFAFFKDRFFRVVPLYWTLTLALALLIVIAPNLFRKLDFSIVWLIKSLTFTSGLVDGSNPIIFAGWTLEYEMLFYVIFSLSLFASSQIKSFLITVVLISFAGLFLNLIMLEFVFGMLVCWLYLNVKCTSKFALVSLCLGFLLLTSSIWVRNLDIYITEAQIHRVIIWGIPSALIVFGAAKYSQTRNKYLISLGNASYSIYLIQIFSIPAFYKIISKLNFSFLNNDVIAILCAVATACVGLLLHIYYEKRIANFLKRWSSES